MSLLGTVFAIPKLKVTIPLEAALLGSPIFSMASRTFSATTIPPGTSVFGNIMANSSPP